jgi:hypothetical protein
VYPGFRGFLPISILIPEKNTVQHVSSRERRSTVLDGVLVSSFEQSAFQKILPAFRDDLTDLRQSVSSLRVQARQTLVVAGGA